jgi:hypothetical protein
VTQEVENMPGKNSGLSSMPVLWKGGREGGREGGRGEGRKEGWKEGTG